MRPLHDGRIRIGLVGAGGIANIHIKGYRANADRMVITAVADADPEVRSRRAAELEATPYDDHLALIDEADVDAVDICLPHHLHADAILAAARAGKHVLCEKPLCLSREEAAAIDRAVNEHSVTVMCAHNQLFLGPVRKATELLAAGLVGKVYEVRTTDSFFNDFDPAMMGWRAHRSTSGGGELIDTGYHPAYLLLHLADAAPTEVAAMVSTHRLQFAEGEDSAQLLVRFANGVVGHLATSWAYQPADCTERFSVVGELGALWATKSELSYRLRTGESETFTFPAGTMFPGQMSHFADCLLQGTRPLHDHRDGTTTLEIILAAYESAETGKFVKVPRR
ncbi:Gfo/Idh/MocA family protein [Propionibacteriaceae bacterium Y1685]|uniref:Gfo/Idh/MocA family protein n=1 Tax=Microlunatus sp. Y1700 TaxID=3418487 RepID=UPI003B791075